MVGYGQGGLLGSRGHSERGCPQAGGRGPGVSSLSTDRACGSGSPWVPLHSKSGMGQTRNQKNVNIM